MATQDGGQHPPGPPPGQPQQMQERLVAPQTPAELAQQLNAMTARLTQLENFYRESEAQRVAAQNEIANL